VPSTSTQPAARRQHDADPAPLFTSLDAAGVRLDLHPRTIRRAIAAGELPGYKFGKALRVRLDELDAWAEAKAMPDPYNGRRRLAKGGASA